MASLLTALFKATVGLLVQKGSSFENEALENEDRSTKHPNLENEAPYLENEAPKSRCPL